MALILHSLDGSTQSLGMSRYHLIKSHSRETHQADDPTIPPEALPFLLGVVIPLLPLLILFCTKTAMPSVPTPIPWALRREASSLRCEKSSAYRRLAVGTQSWCRITCIVGATITTPSSSSPSPSSPSPPPRLTPVRAAWEELGAGQLPHHGQEGVDPLLAPGVLPVHRERALASLP
jgi:hypothetical protein